MRIFPDYWAHPDAELEVMASPEGALCYDCEKPILHTDRGVEMPFAGDPDEPMLIYVHRLCFLRNLGVGCPVCGRQD